MEVNNRSEIVFLYDIKDANPNGDPMDENKPRIDEETEINIVTDVRLKRTIRDYLYEFKGYNGTNEDIFVRKIEYEPGKIQDAKMRAKDFVAHIDDEKPEEKEVIAKFKKGEKISKKYIEIIKDNIRKNIIRKSVDVRLFGATIPLEFNQSEIKEKIKKPIKSSITLTGPVQFRFGRSLHRVEIKHIKGTGAFASGEGKEKKTFREEYILPYSLIAFYGIVNENGAKYTHLKEEDVDEMLDAMWNGTKNLITRTKVGQMPRLLIRVVYKENNYHIGDLDKKIELQKSVDDKEIRDIKDVKIDLTKLYQALFAEKDKIQRVEIEANPDTVFLINGNEYKGREVVNAFAEVNGTIKNLDR